MPRFAAIRPVLISCAILGLLLLLICDLRGWWPLRPSSDAAWQRLLRGASRAGSDNASLLRELATPDARGVDLLARCLQSSHPSLRRAARTVAHQRLDEWLPPAGHGNLPMAACLLCRLADSPAGNPSALGGIAQELAQRVLVCACQGDQRYPDQLTELCESLLRTGAPNPSPAKARGRAVVTAAGEPRPDSPGSHAMPTAWADAGCPLAFEDQFALPGGAIPREILQTGSAGSAVRPYQ